MDHLTQDQLTPFLASEEEAISEAERLSAQGHHAVVVQVDQPAPSPAPAPSTAAALRERWANVARGLWLAAADALARRDYRAMRELAERADAARHHTDILGAMVFGGDPPGIGADLIPFERRGASASRQAVDRAYAAVTGEMRAHELYRRNMRYFEKQAARKGGDARTLYAQWDRLRRSVPAPGTVVEVRPQNVEWGHFEAVLPSGAMLWCRVPSRRPYGLYGRTSVKVRIYDPASLLAPPYHGWADLVEEEAQ